MATQYHLFIGETQVDAATRAKKNAVVKIGDACGKGYTVRTNTGKVVAEGGPAAAAAPDQGQADRTGPSARPAAWTGSCTSCGNTFPSPDKPTTCPECGFSGVIASPGSNETHKPDEVVEASAEPDATDDWEYPQPEGVAKDEPVEEAPAPQPEPKLDEQVAEALEGEEAIAAAEAVEVPTPDSVAKFDLATMKDKIKKLLAKAEGTDNDTERDIYNAKAEALMLKLGVHAAELEASGGKAEQVVEVHRTFHGNYAIVMVPFVLHIANGLGDLTVYETISKTSLDRTCYVVGHKSDVAALWLLVDSLEKQVFTALKRWQRANIEVRRHQTDMVKYLGHRAFIEEFGAVCGRRLEKARKVEVADASPGAALVLASKAAKVEEYMERHTLTPGRTRKGGTLAGRIGGAEAGAKADLGETRLKGNKAELK